MFRVVDDLEKMYAEVCLRMFIGNVKAMYKTSYRSSFQRVKASVKLPQICDEEKQSNEALSRSLHLDKYSVILPGSILVTILYFKFILSALTLMFSIQMASSCHSKYTCHNAIM